MVLEAAKPKIKTQVELLSMRAQTAPAAVCSQVEAWQQLSRVLSVRGLIPCLRAAPS